MSKLDKPAHQYEANACLKVVWLAFDDVDANALRQKLRNAIQQAENRVRLDCREVDGAPNELIDILHEANEFAKCSGKQIALTFASDLLRHALVENNGRFAPAPAVIRGSGTVSAAMAAENSLSINWAVPLSSPLKRLKQEQSNSRWRFTNCDLVSVTVHLMSRSNCPFSNSQT